MPCLRWLVAGLSLYMPVGFVVNRVTQGQVFSPVSILLIFIYLFSLLHNHSI